MRIISKPIIVDVYICDHCNHEHENREDIVKCICGKEVCTDCGTFVGTYHNISIIIHKNKKCEQMYFNSDFYKENTKM